MPFVGAMGELMGDLFRLAPRTWMELGRVAGNWALLSQKMVLIFPRSSGETVSTIETIASYSSALS